MSDLGSEGYKPGVINRRNLLQGKINPDRKPSAVKTKTAENPRRNVKNSTPLPKKISRRFFLREAVLGTAGLVAGVQYAPESLGVLKKLLNKISTASAAPNPMETKASVTPEPAPQPSNVETKTLPEEYTFTQDFITKLSKEQLGQVREHEKIIYDYINLIFEGRSPKTDIPNAMDRIGKELLHLRAYRKGDIEKVTKDGNIKNLIKEIAPTLEFNDDDIELRFVRGLIAIESGGDTRATAPVNKPEELKNAARGLAQIKPDTARTMTNILLSQYKNYEAQAKEDPKKKEAAQLRLQAINGLKASDAEKTNLDLYDPKTNITIALQYLGQLKSMFVDTSLTFWAYHLGEGSMAIVVPNARGKSVEEVTELWKKFNNGASFKGAVQEIRNLINGDNTTGRLNFASALSNSDVVEALASIGAWNDDTDTYAARVIAAQCLIDQPPKPPPTPTPKPTEVKKS